MDIEKHDAKFGSPVLLTLVLLIIIPLNTGYIDCRISCRRCHENTEHPAVLEVYCAMCEECKQRRRERMLGRTTKGMVKPTLKSLVRMRDGVEASTVSNAPIIRPQEGLQQAEQDSQQQYQGQPQQHLEPQQPFQPQQLLEPQQPPQEPPDPQQPQLTQSSQKALRGIIYPIGCPTPPICSDSEDEPEMLKETLPTPTTTPSTTTTRTTTQMPCPPVLACRKKKKNIQHPCMSPCMGPPAMCPCPMFPPPPPPPQGPGCPHPHPQPPVLGYLHPHPHPPVPGMYVSNPPWPPGAFPPTIPQWPVMQSQANQPYDQLTQPPSVVVFQNQPYGPQGQPQGQPQGPMVFSQPTQASAINDDFQYLFIGLPIVPTNTT